jgi:hypothetical protein
VSAPSGKSDEATASRRSHRALGLTLITAASVLAFFTIFALWADRLVLNTDNWTDTSTELLEDDEIRAQVAAFLADELYRNVNVAEELRTALPPRAQPLAEPIAGALTSAAPRVIDALLQRPRVERLWEEANRRAHARLIQVVEGGSDTVSTEGGEVTLDLKALLTQTQDRFGVGGRVEQRLPADAAQIKILKSDQLDLAQDVADLLNALAIVLPAIAIALYALAVYLASGWRRQALRAVGLGLLLAGVAALLGREIAGDVVVDSLASTEAVRPAVENTWSISTELLTQAAVAAVLYGLFIVFAAWIAGPTQLAVRARTAAAPYLREPRFAWGGFAVLVLLLLLWGPTPALRQPITALILIALLAIGLEALRRQTAREHPQAVLGPAPGGDVK